METHYNITSVISMVPISVLQPLVRKTNHDSSTVVKRIYERISMHYIESLLKCLLKRIKSH